MEKYEHQKCQNKAGKGICFKISKNNVKQIVIDGRVRWKIENEDNNVLKIKGYHLEHKFGHVQKSSQTKLITTCFVTITGLDNYSLIFQLVTSMTQFPLL